jgi:hypothetical protein
MTRSLLGNPQRRTASGIGAATRALILKALRGVSTAAVANAFIRGRYGDFDTYVAVVREQWGDEPAREMTAAVSQAAHFQPILVAVPTEHEREEMTCEAILLHMPEPDFRLAVHEACQFVAHPDRAAKRVSAICDTRGIAWRFTAREGFRRIRDTE